MYLPSQRIEFLDATALSTPAIIRSPKLKRAFTRDNFMTFDSLTIDSTGSFLVGELERLDQTLHGPLAAVTWGRDIDLREDVSLADEVSSYTLSNYSAAGGINPAGINWISKEATAIGGINLDIGKITHPLNLWGMELKYSLPELASAEKLGRPVDAQKYEGMKLKHQMDIDQQVYIGNTDYSQTGMANSASVTATNVVNGASGSPLWVNKTPDEVLADVNNELASVWAASAYAVVPAELRVPPNQFNLMVSTKVSTAGNVSIIEFLRNNSIVNAALGKPLNIQPLKWLIGAGVGATDRMMIYTRDKDRIRFPLVPLQRTPLQTRSIWQIVTYYGRLGVVEIVYPQCVGYADGI